MDIIEYIIDKLDPDMSRQEIVELREYLIRKHAQYAALLKQLNQLSKVDCPLDDRKKQ